MNPTDRLLERAARGEDVREEAARYLSAKKQAKTARARRVGPKRAPGLAAEAKREERDAAFYEKAKREAAERAGAAFNEDGTLRAPPRCEYVIPSWLTEGQEIRCPAEAIDPDHVIGGAYRKDSERLGAEGLMCLCRGHHDLKHASTPSRGFWLEQAARHAMRYGYRRLGALVAKALARYEAKHPPRSDGDAAPATTPDKDGCHGND